MTKFVALYRGINVAGKNKVKMESLRAMHERLGHCDVKSYIQSGNVVFAADGTAGSVARQVAIEFASEFGFAPKIVVADANHWRAILQGNPFAKFASKNPKTVHAAVCMGKPSAIALKALLAKTGGTESFHAGSEIVYLHAPDEFGTSKFAAGMEKASGVPMTVRNWRTVEALWGIIGEIDE